MSTATVFVSTDVSNGKFEEIEQFVQNETSRNVSLQGYNIDVRWGDFTCVESASEGDYTLSKLHTQVQNIIDGQ